MLIEFLGAPGVGKSTVSHLVAQLLAERGHTVLETTYLLDHEPSRLKRLRVKLATLFRIATTSPAGTLSELGLVTRTRQSRLRDLMRCSANWLRINSLLDAPRPPGALVVLDQGYGQALWSIGLKACRRDWLDRMTRPRAGRREVRPELIVLVRAQASEICARLAQRTDGASRIDPVHDSCQIIAHSVLEAERIARHLSSMGIQVATIDNGAPHALADTARTLADRIEALLTVGILHEPASSRLAVRQWEGKL